MTLSGNFYSLCGYVISLIKEWILLKSFSNMLIKRMLIRKWAKVNVEESLDDRHLI